MARLMKDFVAEMLYEPPKRAEPKVLVYERVLDRHELQHLKRGAEVEYIRYIKQEMAHKLADHILKECQVFQIPGMQELMRGYPIRMELTINDRGTYENLIPQAERVARSVGVKAGKDEVKRTIPYGFEPEQYYE